MQADLTENYEANRLRIAEVLEVRRYLFRITRNKLEGVSCCVSSSASISTPNAYATNPN